MELSSCFWFYCSLFFLFSLNSSGKRCSMHVGIGIILSGSFILCCGRTCKSDWWMDKVCFSLSFILSLALFKAWDICWFWKVYFLKFYNSNMAFACCIVWGRISSIWRSQIFKLRINSGLHHGWNGYMIVCFLYQNDSSCAVFTLTNSFKQLFHVV